MPRAIGIHIGLNAVDPRSYEGWGGELNACENDARDMAAIGKSQKMRSRALLTKRATRRAVLTALATAARTLKKGDYCFVTYSGHGGQLPDRNHDEPDAYDETWCLYDGEISDDQLDQAWAKFRSGVRILVLSDSCHSGTVTRAAFMSALRAASPGRGLGPHENGHAPRPRAMPMAVAMRVYRAHQREYDRIQKSVDPRARDRVKASVLLISGCQDNQESLDGDVNGLFTENLLRVWKQGRFRGDYRRFHREIARRMPPTQSPNYYLIGATDGRFENQRPFQVR